MKCLTRVIWGFVNGSTGKQIASLYRVVALCTADMVNVICESIVSYTVPSVYDDILFIEEA